MLHNDTALARTAPALFGRTSNRAAIGAAVLVTSPKYAVNHRSEGCQFFCCPPLITIPALIGAPRRLCSSRYSTFRTLRANQIIGCWNVVASNYAAMSCPEMGYYVDQ
jgi:hypothetical protein